MKAVMGHTREVLMSDSQPREYFVFGVNLWLKCNFDLCKVIFMQKIYRPCLIVSGPMYKKPKNSLMLKTRHVTTLSLKRNAP